MSILFNEITKNIINLLVVAIEKQANGFYLALFRIFYALTGIFFAIRTTQQIDLIWSSKSDATLNILFFLHLIWLTLVILMLFGLGGRLVLIGHFILAMLLLDFENSGHTMEDNLYLIAGFWMMFMKLDTVLTIKYTFRRVLLRTDEPIAAKVSTPAWPLYLLGLNVGMIIFTAGLSKWLDPLWRHGVGLYYTYLLPWIKPAFMSFLLDWHSLMIVMNYAVIGFELSFLFLFIYPRTRLLSLLLLVGFFGTLTFPLRIDFIGPIGLVYCVGLVSITPSAQKLIQLTLNYLFGERILLHLGYDDGIATDFYKTNDNLPKTPTHSFLAWVTPTHQTMLSRLFVIAMFLYLFFFFTVSLARSSERLTYPMILYPLSLQTAEQEIDNLDEIPAVTVSPKQSRFWRIFRRLTNSINMHTTKIQVINVFNSVHTIGVYAYRVEVSLQNGEKLEPVVVFQEDKTPGPGTSGLIPRWLQARMYVISNLAHKLSSDPSYQLTPYEKEILDGLLQFTLSKLNVEQMEQASHVSLLVSPILVPFQYEGNVQPWLEAPWMELYTYDIEQATYAIVEIPEAYPLRIKVLGLEDTWITISP